MRLYYQHFKICGDKHSRRRAVSDSKLYILHQQRSAYVLYVVRACLVRTGASKLPASGQVAGDVYDIQAASSYGPAGTNVAWNGTAWDALGGAFTIEECTNAEIDQIFTDLAAG